MIHKVNRPEFRLVVNSTKQTENDPGSSQGGGVAYEKFQKQEKPSDEEQSSEEHSSRSEIDIRAQIDLEQLALEYHGGKRLSGSNPGLTTQYHQEASQSKGLLLNKKAE